MFVRRMFRAGRFAAVILLLVLLLVPEWSAVADESSQIKSVVQLREFDYLVWEANALFGKSESTLSANQRFLNETARKETVLRYLQLVADAQRIEGELNQIYGDPNIVDPDSEAQDLQKELKQIRTSLAEQQSLAEAIVQEQVAAVLNEQGFTLLGRAWPPVLMHVTPLPSLLVISPREHIEKIHEVSLQDGLTTPEKESIESSVFENLDRSALVVPLGGIGTYPSMISETSNINRLTEVVAHEWTHHWLTLHPLGFSYAFDPNVRIINETVASLVDQEIGGLVVEQFYPEYLPPLENDQPAAVAEEDPDAFDFRSELAQTRVETERLLAEGKIDDAEAYMEARRQLFWDEGYRIRKLNQAYFAFYGAYAADPGGAQGGNPIGPMLRDIRAHSSSIKAFLETVAPITSFEDLEAIHNQFADDSPSE